MKLYSTLDRKIVDIEEINPGEVSIYSCGPTVYGRMHVGNLRAYVDWDILHRSFLYLGYKVNRVMNFTDVGHMTADRDFGEDKIEKTASSQGKNPLDISNEYIVTVLDDFSKLNILSPSGEIVNIGWDLSTLETHGWLRATSYIKEIIEIIKRIEENGYTYETDQAVYFDVTKVKDYTIFTGQSLEEKDIASRDEVEIDEGKRHPADFVLWMKRTGKYANHLMHWDSPWGDGFPGWHIECSAMSTSRLGEHFDIHTGGIDHMSVHHPNERAQNIGAYGHSVVKYWVHNEFIVGNDNGKLSKSAGDALTLPDVIRLGFDPLDLRYLFASVNYRVQLKFSLEALEGARNARMKIFNKILSIKEISSGTGNVLPEYIERFKGALDDNLNVSECFAILNEVLKSDNNPNDILATIYDFDKVLGFDFVNIHKEESIIPEEINSLLEERKVARDRSDYAQSDRIRDIIYEKGYKVLDTPAGQVVEKI